MFIKKHHWDEAGGFDERFFAHMEEIDLCWRLKNRGYKVMYCADSEVFHLGGGTLNVENPFKTFLNFRNNLLLLQNNLSFWRALLIIPIRIFMDLLAIFRFLGEGKRKDAWAVSRAHQNFVGSLFKVKSKWLKANGENSSQLPTANCKPKSANHRLNGMYRGSIVWAFFIQKKRIFTQLNPEDFF
jgi:GT2 family glycosyltransferase